MTAEFDTVNIYFPQVFRQFLIFGFLPLNKGRGTGHCPWEGSWRDPAGSLLSVMSPHMWPGREHRDREHREN